MGVSRCGPAGGWRRLLPLVSVAGLLGALLLAAPAPAAAQTTPTITAAYSSFLGPEGDAGHTDVTVTFTLTNPNDGSTSFQVCLSGTAALGDDYEYTDTAGDPHILDSNGCHNISFSSGGTHGTGPHQYVTKLRIIGDTENERRDDTIIVTIGSATNGATVPRPTDIYTIVNDDWEANADGSWPVPENWGLTPSGLEPGDRFRLLIKTWWRTAATHHEIARYDEFVHTVLRNAVHPVLKDRQFVTAWQAVGSTPTTDARDHLGMWSDGAWTDTNTAEDPNANTAVYWLSGAKVADNYAEFCSASWDTTGHVPTSDENGNQGANENPWTGSRPDCTGSNFQLSKQHVRVGGVGGPLTEPGPNKNFLRDEQRQIFGLSPVLLVTEAPAVETGPRVTLALTNAARTEARTAGPEGNAGLDDVYLRITALDLNPGQTDVRICLGGTATLGVDYKFTNYHNDNDVFGVVNGCLTHYMSRIGTRAEGVVVQRLRVVGDAVKESDETITVTVVSAGNGVSISEPTVTYTIEDDDTPELSVSLSATEGAEGDSPFTDVTVQVGIAPTHSAGTGIRLCFSGTATRGSSGDYQITSLSNNPWSIDAEGCARYNLAGGSSGNSLKFRIRGDLVAEPDETIIVTVHSHTPGVRTDADRRTATYTITDDDPELSVRLGETAAAEGNTGHTDVSLFANLSVTKLQHHHFRICFSGTATRGSGGDYIVIGLDGRELGVGADGCGPTIGYGAAGDLHFKIRILGDTVPERDETVVAVIESRSAGLGVNPDQETVTYTIEDDEPRIGVSLGSISGAEGDSGGTDIDLNIEISPPLTELTWIHLCFTGTATHGSDGDWVYYNPPNDTSLWTLGPDNCEAFSLPATWTGHRLKLRIIGDTLLEPDETVTVTINSLTEATGVDLDKRTATYTIRNDEPTLSVHLASDEGDEGHSGLTDVNVDVKLSPFRSEATSVKLCLSGTATEGSGGDYRVSDHHNRDWSFDAGGCSGAFSLAAEAVEHSLKLRIAGDTVPEADETVTVTVHSETAAVGVDPERGSATYTIRDDEPRLRVTLGQSAGDEGDTGHTDVSVHLNLSPPLAAPAAGIKLCLTGTAARGAGGDYQFVDARSPPVTIGADGCSGAFSLPAGTTGRSFKLRISGDNDGEAHETVTVTARSDNAAVGVDPERGSATYTIRDDEPMLSVRVLPTSGTEGDSGLTDVAVDVDMSSARSEATSVNICFSGTATLGAGGDYRVSDYTDNYWTINAQGCSGAFNLNAGVTHHGLKLRISGDTVPEADETVTVTVHSETPGVGTDADGGTATYTITDDEPQLSVRLPRTAGAEGNTGHTDVSLVTNLSVAKLAHHHFRLCFSGTATHGAGGDYIVISWDGQEMTLGGDGCGPTIGYGRAGDLGFRIRVLGDAVFERDETVVAAIESRSAGVGVRTGRGTVTYTITDDDSGLNPDGTRPVRADWELKPAGLDVKSKFRLLFKTSTRTQAGAADIADYDDFIRTALAATGHGRDPAYRQGWKAVGSTAAVDAREHLDMWSGGAWTDKDASIPIYWVNGNKAADSYADLCDGSWDSAGQRDARDEAGKAALIDGPWTGSDNDCTGHANHLGHAASVRQGASAGPLSHAAGPPADRHTMFALSPVFIVTPAEPVHVFFEPRDSVMTEGLSTDPAAVDMRLSRALSAGESLTVQLSQDHIGKKWDYALAGAPAGVTLDAAAGRLTMNGDAAPQTVTVNVIARDHLVAGDQQGAAGFFIQLDSVKGGTTAVTADTGADNRLLLAVNDGDTTGPRVRVSASPTTAREGASVTLTFTLSAGRSEDTAVQFVVARSGQEVGAPTGTGVSVAGGIATVSIPAGQTTATATLPIVDDADIEDDHHIYVMLGDQPAGVRAGARALGPGFARVNIQRTPVVSLNLASAEGPEGATGYTDVRVDVDVDPTHTQAISLEICFIGTATHGAGADYQVTGLVNNPWTLDGDGCSSAFTLPPGAAGASLKLRIRGDTDVEDDETVTVSLLTTTAEIAVDPATATYTIRNDDVGVALSLTAPEGAEGGTGYTDVGVQVSIAPVHTAAVSLKLCFTGTATHGASADYQVAGLADSPWTLDGDGCSSAFTVPAGSAGTFLKLRIRGDADVEDDETVIVAVSTTTAGVGVHPDRSTATYTVQDDDIGFSITLARTEGAEGSSGHTDVDLTVGLNRTLEYTAEYRLCLAGTATYGAGADYQVWRRSFAATLDDDGCLNGGVRFGHTSYTLRLRVNGDADIEFDETVVFTVSSSTAGVSVQPGRDTLTYTIRADEPAFSVKLAQAEGVEGDSSYAEVGVTATLSGAASGNKWARLCFSGTAAHGSGGDFRVFTAGGGELGVGGNGCATPFRFSGNGDVLINLRVSGDTTPEQDETIIVTIVPHTPGVAVVPGHSTATYTITNDEPMFSLSLPTAEGPEGDSGHTDVAFAVNIPTALTTAPPYTICFGGTATYGAGEDFTVVNDRGLPLGVTNKCANHAIRRNESSRALFFRVRGDAQFEPDETIIVTITSGTAAVGVVAGQSSGTYTIRNDEQKLSFSRSEYIAFEGTVLGAEMRLAKPRTEWTSFTVVVTPGTATAGQDYGTSTNTRLSVGIPPGTTESAFNIGINNDQTEDDGETFTIEIDESTVPAGVTVGSPKRATVTIREGITVGFVTSTTVVSESAGDHDLTVSFSRASPAFTLHYTTPGSTAVCGYDYTIWTRAGGNCSRSIEVASGAESVRMPLSIKDDDAPEQSELIKIKLQSDHAGVTVTTGGAESHAVLISDNDTPPEAPNVTASLSDVASGRVESVIEGTRRVLDIAVDPAAKARFHLYATVAHKANPDPTLRQPFTIDDTESADMAQLEHVIYEFAPGATAGELVFGTVDDNIVEDDATITFTLKKSGAARGVDISSSKGSIDVLVRDDDSAEVYFYRKTDGGNILVHLKRPVEFRIKINVHKTDGSIVTGELGDHKKDAADRLLVAVDTETADFAEIDYVHIEVPNSARHDWLYTGHPCIVSTEMDGSVAPADQPDCGSDMNAYTVRRELAKPAATAPTVKLAAVAPVPVSGAPSRNADGSYTVPADWPLVPGNLEPGDKFRLLFRTTSRWSPTGTRNISTYDGYVQSEITGGSLDAIKPYAADFKVVGSTRRQGVGVDIRTHLDLRSGGNWRPGIPIFWMDAQGDGRLVADDYEDFCDREQELEDADNSPQIWWKNDNLADQRNEDGASHTDSNAPFTGSNNDCTPHFRHLGYAGHNVYGAHRDGRSGGPLNTGIRSDYDQASLYGMSPVFVVGPPARVFEGGSLIWSLTATPAPAEPLVAWVWASQAGGDFVDRRYLTRRDVVIPTSGRATVTIPTVNDDKEENDGWVELEILRLYGSGGFTVAGGDGGRSLRLPVLDDDGDGTQGVPLSAEPPAGDPEVNITSTLTAGVEGRAVEYRLTANPRPAADLTVTVTIGQTGDFVAAGELGRRKVTITPRGIKDIIIPTVDDAVDEPDGAVTLTIETGSGYTVGPLSAETLTVADNDAPPPPEQPQVDTSEVEQLIQQMIVRHRDVTGNAGALANWEKALRSVRGEPGGFTIAELEAHAASVEAGAPR
ncbi:MAG: hypothetical protein OXG91_10900, partial [bacterium]|nr:hypothetical protein [bacterium]